MLKTCDTTRVPGFKSRTSFGRSRSLRLCTNGVDYKPGEKSMTAFEVARHIVVCEIWFLDAILTGQFADEAARPAQSATTCQELADWYATSARERLPLLEHLSTDD